MSAPSSNDELLIEKLLAHLKAEGYSLRIQQRCVARVRQLLEDCTGNTLEIEAVLLGLHHALLAPTLSALPQATRRGVDAIPQMAPSIHRCHQTLLRRRTVTADSGLTEYRVEAFTEISSTTTMHGCAICADCGRRRGPSCTTCALQLRVGRITCRRGRPRQPHGCRSRCVLEAVLRRFPARFHRRPRVCLRDFLRHLHRSELTAADLSGTVIGPRIYEHEDIPSPSALMKYCGCCRSPERISHRPASATMPS